MLQKLHIQNYAIISEIEINFHPRLNCITGETGAGKSILMGALSLILGDRADTSVLQNREKKCVVEGYFGTGAKKEIQDFLRAADLDPEEELVIRREISASGKSRAFINDTPVNLEQLRSLSNLLVDLHRQFDTLDLGEQDFQRQVLDALAGHADQIQVYQADFFSWNTRKQEIAKLLEQKAQFSRESDYNKFLYTELEEADFKENELEEADAALKLQSQAEGIKTILEKIGLELEGGDQPMAAAARSLAAQLQSYSSYHTAIPEIINRLNSVYLELQDIAAEAEQVSDKIFIDPASIEALNERVNTGYKLLKKHGLKTTQELLQLKGELETKLAAVLNIDEQILQLQAEAAKMEARLQKAAVVITNNRNKQLKPTMEKVNRLLHQVGMPNARLLIQVSPVPLHAFGADAIEFLFDANQSGKTQRFEPIRKVASGGELSRLMLCIKSLVAQSLDLSTLIFDEIDTGISGEAARQVGIILKELARSRQVISITHQPQIAGKADAHYFVYKEIKGDRIVTGIRELSQDERITAIARMLSGEQPTAAALENAREMIMN